MALQSIEKKQAEIRAARAGVLNGTSEAKRTLIRVRTGLLIGGVLLIALEVGLSVAAMSVGSTVFGYLGALMLCAWVVALFAGMFVK